MNWRQVYFERYYYSRAGFVDGTTEFHRLIATVAGIDKAVIELGPGPGGQTRTTPFLCEHFHAVDGIDVDPEVRQNPDLRTVMLYDGAVWPVADGTYDCVVADYVLEHLADPKLTVAEIARVLKPGGHFVFRTPNIWHYTGIVAKLVPNSAHSFFSKAARAKPRDAHDTYPTFHRMNTRGAVRKLCGGVGLEMVHLRMIEKEPSYGQIARPAFFVCMAYERAVNHFESLAWARVNILGLFRKP